MSPRHADAASRRAVCEASGAVCRITRIHFFCSLISCSRLSMRAWMAPTSAFFVIACMNACTETVLIRITVQMSMSCAQIAAIGFWLVP